MDGQALRRTRPVLPAGLNQRCVLIHPSHPSGHSFTARQADSISYTWAVCLRRYHADLFPGGPAKIGSINPHAMQDNRELACERHLGELCPAPLRDPHRPAPKPRPAPMMHENMGCLIECRSHHFVTAAADMAVIVNLPRAVAAWR